MLSVILVITVAGYHVRTGGSDIDELDPKWFRQHVAMVGQEPVLFGCTIRENIAYGKDASLEEASSDIISHICHLNFNGF